MNTIDIFFSAKYINQNAAKNNLIIYLLGRLSYPLAALFAKVGTTPNQITTLSTLLAISSAIALASDSALKIFVLLWSFSLLLDFCDGAVARMTDQVRKAAFRYDHTSDLFKIFIVILGVAIRHDDVVLWGASMSASFFFMLYTVLNHEYGYIDKENILLNKKENDVMVFDGGAGLKKKIKDYISGSYFESFVVNLYMILFTINGHSLLLFLLFYYGRDASFYVMIYLMMLSVRGVYQNINKLQLVRKL